ncbi:MAG: DEAD/DEAH box helicase family protein, partial [Polyangiaceae bacterium]|nr:DEAD/DEAH box helicase family protein [Polyangiaceae bacterium]
MTWSDWLDRTSEAKENFEKIIKNSEKLRDYQKETIFQLRDFWLHSRQGRILVALPTGAGKTRIAAQVVKLEQNAERTVLWLVHRKELFDQTI